MTLNHKVVGSIPTASTKWFFMVANATLYGGAPELESWGGLSWFKSNLPHHTKVKNGRDMEAIHLQL